MTRRLEWKNTLLSKEDPRYQQNPVKYIEEYLIDMDAFMRIYDKVIDFRDEGRYFIYRLLGGTRDSAIDPKLAKGSKAYNDGIEQKLESFLIVRDDRGVLWICPIIRTGDLINHKLMKLDLMGIDSSTAVLYHSDPSYCVGQIKVPARVYSESCAMGFDNAAQTLLGQKHVTINQGYEIVAVFDFV